MKSTTTVGRTWRNFQFTVGMPHMVPGKMSEVELLKVLGDHQWDSIGTVLAQKSSDIANAAGERLYASFINIEISFSEEQPQHSFGEGTPVMIDNSLDVFANKFIEGFSLFSSAPIDGSVRDAVASRADLERLECGWAYLTNAFVTRVATNSRLAVFEPAGMSDSGAARATTLPVGIAEHEAVQFTGDIPTLLAGDTVRLPTFDGRPVSYQIVPESDLNGAGLLYFARYVAIMNYGERVFLSERVDRPWSRQLIGTLSTERRTLYYFGNADPSETLRVSVTAQMERGAAESADHRAPTRVQFRTDLYRASDNVLIASGAVRKSLAIPPSDKALLAEAARIRLHALRA